MDPIGNWVRIEAVVVEGGHRQVYQSRASDGTFRVMEIRTRVPLPEEMEVASAWTSMRPYRSPHGPAQA